MNETADLIALGDCVFLPVNAETTAVLNRSNGAMGFVSGDVARALKHCLCLHSAAHHAQVIAAHLPGLRGEESAVVDTLRALEKSELFLSSRQISDRLAHSTQPAALARTLLFVITCDRPRALKRLLDSLQDFTGLTRFEQLFVVDDSRSDENIAQNRDIIEQFSTRSALTAIHLCPERQRRAVAYLAQQLPELGAGIHFLLDRSSSSGRKSYGLARNFALALSAGRRALVMDDDILPYQIKAPAPQGRVTFAAGVASSFSFFPSLDRVLDSIDTAERNALDGMADVLGRSVAELPAILDLGAYRGSDLEGAPGVILEALTGDTRVLVTQCGTLGDPGTDGLGWLQRLDPQSVSSLRAALGARNGAQVARCCWRGVSGPTIAKMASMSQLTGIDHSRLMPPYFPYFRGEDALFGACVDFIHGDSVALELPWCVAHLPDEARAAINLDSDPIMNTGSLGTLAKRISSELDPRGSPEAADRLAEIARFCRHEAGKTDHVLRSDYRAEQIRRHVDLLNTAQVQKQRIGADTPDGWVHYLDRCLQVAGNGLQHPWTPGAIAGEDNDDAAARVLAEYRTMLNGFANGIDAWPAICAHASDLRERAAAPTG